MYEDLSGKKFGYLTVIDHAGIDKFGKHTWNCVCRCGNRKIISSNGLKCGDYKSCGCQKSERFSKINTIHGKCKTRLYKTWKNMKTRCLNSKNYKFKNYGGRGICICTEWLDFENFERWALSSGYQNNLTIERIDVNGNYCPQNCTWIIPENQALNRRNTKKVMLHGEKMTVKELSKIMSISESCIYKHIAKGMIDFTDYFETGLPFYTVK